MALICMFLATLSGCQKKDVTIAGVDIPIPSQMKKISDKVAEAIPGYDDGQAAFQGKAAEGEIFNFYQENMEARGWKPTTFMVSKKGQLAYTKDGRICLVWYTPNSDGTTSLIIMIGTTQPTG
jgi:hypothetical protein